MEKWVSIDQILYPIGKFQQTYSISNHGNVQNDKTGRLLKARPDNKGYMRVNLAGKDQKVHRLVALHFLINPKPNDYSLINHKDGDKSNNHESNLEWCNNSMNIKHAVDTGLKSAVGEKNSHAKLSDQDVLDIWNSNLTTKEIEEQYNVTKVYASRLKNKRVRRYLLGE